MNFVVAALILARFHDLSALAASSELDEDTWPPSSPEASEEYVPNYEAEADVFWLFQVVNFENLSLTCGLSHSSLHFNPTAPLRQPSRESLSLLDGQFPTERFSAWRRFGPMGSRR
jgi:hypothetical protein